MAFRLGAAGVKPLLHSPRFFETPYGRGLWISVWADGRLNWTLIADLVSRSYRTVALKRMLNRM